MTDRNVQYPKRYQMVPVQGTTDIVDLTPAPGEVYDEGTMINKATLLKDTTAALFGLGTDAVPDDVFAWLGKYNQYWWRCRVNTEDPIYEEKQSAASPNVPAVTPYLCLLNPNAPSSGTVTYSDSVDVNLSTGDVTLVDSKQSSFDYYNDAVGQSFKGKYVTGLYNAPDNIYFIESDATYNRSGWGNYWVIGYNISDVKLVTSELNQNPTIGDWIYIYSSNRSAYPDSGVQGGYEYEYLGIPFENAVGAPKIETGSYVGTGTYGASNPNSLTFGFVPKVVFIGVAISAGSGYYPMYLLSGSKTAGAIDSSRNIKYVSTTFLGNSVSWYAFDNQDQMNYANQTYTYLALG